jgi:hypothetical protein
MRPSRLLSVVQASHGAQTTMPGVQYQHIGHDPRRGTIALWSVDDQGRLHESRKRFGSVGEDWLNWSHEKQFREVRRAAAGRVEIESRSGSIHVNEPAWSLNEAKLCKLLNTLDKMYPATRWFLFGPGFQGESVTAYLSGKAKG